MNILLNLYKEKFDAFIGEEKYFPKNYYKCFEQDKFEIIIFGQDPYPREESATGLAFEDNAVSWNKKIPPSLRNIMLSVLESINVKLNNINDLRDFLKNKLTMQKWFEFTRKQGVCWLNTALTFTTKKDLKKHKLFWRPFILEIIKIFKNKIFILWGNHAKDLIPFIDSDKIITNCHPVLIDFLTTNNFKTSANLYPIKWFPVINLVGFSGKRGVGKDTAGSYLVQKGWKRYAFADPLKLGCNQFFNFKCEKDEICPYWGVSPREVYQKIGTEVFREIDKIFKLNVGNDFWIKRFLAEYDPNIKTVITDVRFPNEAEAIKKLGGIIIKISRETGFNDNHSSENSIGEIKADYEIFNRTSIEDLYLMIDKITKL